MGKQNASKEPRLTLSSMKVLELFSRRYPEQLSGVEVRKTTGLATGTLYPILLRFEEYGWLKSEWESVDSSKVGRPRKRLYRLTGIGQRKVSELPALLGWGRMA